jgi:outer membrane protein assembly factor BamB
LTDWPATRTPALRPEESARSGLGRGLARLLLFLPAWSSVAAGAPQVDDQRGTQLFALSEDREARSLFDSARSHLEAERWERAAQTLQDLLEHHRSDVLPALAGLEEAPFSTYDHYLGAAEWAQRKLVEYAEALEPAYRERFGAAAEARYLEAVGDGDRQALAEVAWRWPLTEAAERSLWSLGDLAFADGRFDAAEAWWRQAGAGEQVAGARAVALDAARRRDTRPGDRSFDLAHPGALPKAPGGDGQEQWSLRLPAGPFGGPSSGTGRESWNLWPVLVDDRIYVSTSLELLAVDAFSGERLWISPKPEGWAGLTNDERTSFWRPVDLESALIAPAVGSGIAVAPLHVPLSRNDDSSIANTRITVKIPERRLFAFDARTGEPLWDHAPPASWDGYTPVAFEQEMHVAGPPVVSEGRLFVPCTLMQGRIKLHVACYDLFDGRLLWQTPVISGQQELNMFNRHLFEFSAAPVHLDGDRLFITTQLGCVAALDAASGRLIWEARYEQIPLPRNHGLITDPRKQYWRNAPPLVADGAVLATPTDSEELLAFDRDTGAVLWSRPIRRLNAGDGYLDVLLGATEDTVYLGGDHLASLRRSGGLANPDGSLIHTEPNLTLSGRDDLGGYRANYDPRGLLCEDAVLIPMDDGLLTIDRRSGSLRSSTSPAWRSSEGQGNLAVSDGLLVSLRGNLLTGYLDLGALESRSREILAQDPGQSEARIELARLLDRRGLRARENGEIQLALRRYEEAADLLVGLEPLDRARVAAIEVGLLRHWAALLEDEGLSFEARERLELARTLAPSADMRLAVLLDLERSLRYDRADRWLALLDDLERTCGDLILEGGDLSEQASWTEWLSPERNVVAADVPVRLWVQVRRALGFERQAEVAGAVEAWHGILADYGNFPVSLGITAGARAEARLRAWIDQHGEAWLEPFEQRALDQLESLDAGDDRALEALARRFPLTRAAARAQELRLDAAAESGAADAASEAARWLLARGDADAPGAWSRERVRQTLGRALGEAGNQELQAALDRVVTGEPAPTRAAPPVPTFDSGVGLGATLPGEYLMVGRLPQTSAEPERKPLLVWREDRLELYEDPTAADPRWSSYLRLDSEPLNRPHRWLVGAERVGVVNFNALLMYDTATGDEAWRWPTAETLAIDDVKVHDVCRESGVVLALEDRPDGRTTVRAFDEHGGAELWHRDLEGSRGWLPPLAAEGRAVLVKQTTGRPTRVELLDLFDGSTLGTTELPEYLGEGAMSRAIVARGTLILSSFREHWLYAIDLQDGRRRWSYQPREGQELFALLSAAERCFAIEVPQSLGQGAGGELLEFEPRLGSRRVIHRLSPNERLVGIPRRECVRLEREYVLSVTNSPATRSTPVGCIDLNNGLRWLRDVPVGHEELYDSQWTPPVFGDEEVLFVYSQSSGTGARSRNYYAVFFDLARGIPRDTRVIPQGRAGLQRVEALGFDSSLWLGCLSSRASEDRILVWSPTTR